MLYYPKKGKNMFSTRQENIAYEKAVKDQDIDKTVKLRRRIEDYLRKYATEKQLDQVADLLNIKK